MKLTIFDTRGTKVLVKTYTRKEGLEVILRLKEVKQRSYTFVVELF